MKDSVVKIVQALFGMLLIVSVVGLPFACTMHEDYQIAKMVQAGASPLAARCAIRASSNRDACLVDAAKGTK